MNRSYASGAQKRRLKEKKLQEMKRMKGSLLNYTTKINSESVPKIIEEKSCDEKSSCSELLATTNLIDSSENQMLKDSCSNSEIVDANEEITDESPANVTSDEREDNLEIVADPALWDQVTETMREYFIRYPVEQNTHLIGHTERSIGDKKRSLTEVHFFRYKCNQEKVKREWLTLSPTTFSLFCWICKLFSNTASTLSTTGFSDWKHVTERLHEHENSFSHREAVCKMFQRKQISNRIDSSMVNTANCESKYWYEVLRRVVAATKFLATRGLPFFGRNETIGSRNNGNFLGCLELMSEFDPFLANHLEKYGNCGTGHTSYLSSTILNEFINLMAKKVLDYIVNEIKCAKFFSIIVDSTPDLTHTDQLTFVVRYVSSENVPVERFLTFLPIEDHSSQHLEETVVNYMESVGLDIANCRGQSYDNASNMAGKYTGLQARLKLTNPLADFVPCAAHSLNLVVVKAVECNGKVLDFFTFLQALYNFFSVSTHRWRLLNEKGIPLTLKSRSITRWCANAAATKAFQESYNDISDVLSDISSNMNQTPSTRNEANSLHKKMQKLETALCACLWNAVLQRIDCISKNLQNPTVDLSKVPEYFSSLIEYIQFVRNNFEKYEEKAYALVGHKNYCIKRQKKISKFFDDGQFPNTVLDNRDDFKVSCFYAVCDTLITHLNSRMSAYDGILKKFCCLFDSDKQTAYENAKVLQAEYSSDLEEGFPDEFIHIFSTMQKDLSIADKLKKIHNFGIIGTFANVETALRLFLTLPISNCSGERSFSLLKRIKSPLRTLIADDKLSSLALLSIEGDITEKIDYDDVIKLFTEAKLRKKLIKAH